MSLSTDTTEISVFIQEDCLRHRFIRSKDVSNIVERPERLRAVNIGISAAISRLESVSSGFDSSNEPVIPTESKSDIDLTDDLTAALDKLKLASSSYPTPLPLNLVKSSAKVELLNNPAVKFVHGDIDGDMYLENLIKWSKESRDRIAQDGTEIPSPLSQGDLYCSISPLSLHFDALILQYSVSRIYRRHPRRTGSFMRSCRRRPWWSWK